MTQSPNNEIQERNERAEKWIDHFLSKRRRHRAREAAEKAALVAKRTGVYLNQPIQPKEPEIRDANFTILKEAAKQHLKYAERKRKKCRMMVILAEEERDRAYEAMEESLEWVRVANKNLEWIDGVAEGAQRECLETNDFYQDMAERVRQKGVEDGIVGGKDGDGDERGLQEFIPESEHDEFEEKKSKGRPRGKHSFSKVESTPRRQKKEDDDATVKKFRVKIEGKEMFVEYKVKDGKVTRTTRSMS